MKDSKYRLKLIDNLEIHNHYNEYFDTFNTSKLSALNLYVYIELTTPPTPQTIENEKRELRKQWQSDQKVYVTVYLWESIWHSI